MITIGTRTTRRVTRKELDGHHGIDRGRKLVVALESEDLVVIRPLGTRRAKKMSVFDIYDTIIRNEALCVRLEKARAVKERKAARLGEMRELRAMRRVVEQV